MVTPRSKQVRLDHPIFAVVIPTYGEAPFLENVLTALAGQTYADFDILVVDNNPEPRACKRCAGIPRPIELLHCPKRGLSAARNAGITATRAEYIAFLDDDSIPAPTWAEELDAGLRRHDCGAAGGRVELSMEGDLPGWYPERMRCLLSELDYDSDIPAIGDSQYVVGANFCVARRYIELVGGFREDFGRDGPRLQSNEELELCRRIIKAGGAVTFLARAVVRHRIPKHRSTFRFLLQRSLWQGRSDAALDVLHGRAPIFRRRSNILNFVALCHRIWLLGIASNRKEAALAAAHIAREAGYLDSYFRASGAQRKAATPVFAERAKAGD